MTDREVMQQALEALRVTWYHVGTFAPTDEAIELYDEAITALREALAQPEQEPVKLHEAVISAWSLREVYFDEDGEPSMHRSPPAAQPESCQTCVEIHSLLDADESMIIKNARDGYPEGRTPREFSLPDRVKALCKYAADWKRWCIEAQTPPAAQPEPPPEWELINNILAEYGLQAIDFVADWKAAQRPWQGLTEEELQFYIKKHSKLVNAGYDKLTDTNLVAKTFDSTGFYKEVSTVLKERNT